MKFSEEQMQQLAAVLATKEDLNEVKADLNEVKTDILGLKQASEQLDKKVSNLQDTMDTFAGEIATKRDEDLIVKQHACRSVALS